MTRVDIFGQQYSIRGEQDPETMRVLARHVDLKMRQVCQQIGTGDSMRVAVLAALNIADEYYQTRAALGRREKEIAEQARTLARRLGEAIEMDAEDLRQ